GKFAGVHVEYLSQFAKGGPPAGPGWSAGRSRYDAKLLARRFRWNCRRVSRVLRENRAGKQRVSPGRRSTANVGTGTGEERQSTSPEVSAMRRETARRY